MFNGMLFQTNPSQVFDRSWPAGWHWSDMAPYFDRVRQRVPVTNTPSTDGLPQNTGPAQIIHPLYAGNGWIEGDTSLPFAAPGVYSRRTLLPRMADAPDRSLAISGRSMPVAPPFQMSKS